MLCINMSFSDIEDENIFERLYYKYRNLMYTVAFDILHNTSDAEDAVSEAFLRIAKNFSLVDKRICPKTANQFVIIVRNISIDMYRKNKRESQQRDAVREVSYSDFEGFECGGIMSAINSLPQATRDTLYLNCIYGFSPEEISKLLGAKPDAIYKRLQRAKAKLWEILKEEKQSE